jgi:serine/threonine protein kinase
MIPELLAKHGLYHLTACTGSIPYVAPEVAKREPYNEKCDVYSFGMLFWEILELKSALEAFPSPIKTPLDYGRVVLKGGCRPAIRSKWPLFTRQVLKMSWVTSISQRPSMSQICTMLQADLKKMTTDVKVVDRSAHMMQKSSRSWHGRSV